MTTVLAGLLVPGSWVLLRKLGPGPAGTLCLWPAVSLLAVQRQYAFPWLETGLGLLGALWLAAAYAWVPAKRPWLRWLVFLGISWPSYALLAGAYLAFALYCGLVEVLAWRRYWLALALWGLAAAVPAVGAWFFAVHPSEAYLLLLPFGLGHFPIVVAALPYAALPLAGLAKAARPFLNSAWQDRRHSRPPLGPNGERAPSRVPTFSWTRRKIGAREDAGLPHVALADKSVRAPARGRARSDWRRLVEPALFALLAVAAVAWGWNPTPQRLARIRCLSHDHDWGGVLKEARLLSVVRSVHHCPCQPRAFLDGPPALRDVRLSPKRGLRLLVLRP